MTIPKPSSVFPGGGLFQGILWITVLLEYLWTLASRIHWYLVESILPSTTIFPVPPAATQPQSIMDPPPCLTVGKVFVSTKASPFFSKHTFFGGGQIFHFGFVTPNHIVPKGFSMFSFTYFRRLILCWGCSFWQLCHVGLCSLKYVVLLSCKQLELCLQLFFAALLQWCVGFSH